MIRVIVTIADAGMAANVGGPVEVSARTFDVSAPELEAFLRVPPHEKYTSRFVSGVEILEPKS